MSYQVIARKYRPQVFSEVIGQEHVTKTLKNAIALGRLHHAYLFTGARGIGKTTVARILAKAMNCKERVGDEPCCKCSSCMEITAGSSLDVQEIDGASNTSVEDVRELRDKIRYAPSSSKYKIYIIDEVHMLSTSAFNALLKTLEEPPAHAIFILATTELHKIPATILSRCQRYDFRRISFRTIADVLSNISKTENVSIDDESLYLIAHESTGSLRDAQSLLDQAIAFAGAKVSVETIRSMLGTLDRKRIFETVEAFVDREPANALKILDAAFESGADLSRLAVDILEIIRDMLVIAECPSKDAPVFLPEDEIEMLKKMVAKTSPAELHMMFSVCYQITESVARSQFPKMIMEVGLIKMCRIGEVKKIGDVIEGLEKMISARPDLLAQPARPSLSVPTKPTTNENKNFSVSQPAAPANSFKQPAPREAAPAVKAQTVEPLPIPASSEPVKKSDGLSFEPGVSPVSAGDEKLWQDFLRALVAKKPQNASIVKSGALIEISSNVVKLQFTNPLYADMIVEVDRKKEIEAILTEVFGKKMLISAISSGTVSGGAEMDRTRREKMREALGNDIVKQTADIFGARIHDVKVGGEGE